MGGIDSYLGRGESSVQAVLELSYQNLATQLKSCFLCVGFFKEDAPIPAKDLVHMWVALELVSQEEVGREETMEDVARGYLDELINRNMVQINDTTKDGRVKKCHIHDLVRDLSIEKAKEEINFEIEREDGSSHSYPLHHPRHRAVYSSRSIIDSTNDKNEHLRSLIVNSSEQAASLSSSYWKNYQLLRVFIGSSVYWESPDAIGASIGLRYVATSLRSGTLPRSFSKLENLQTIDLMNCNVKVPNFIWRMERLRHFKSKTITTNPHVKIHTSLKNLQTLGYLILEDPFIEQLTKIPGLRKLGLSFDRISNVSRLFTALGKHENLVRLHLKGRVTFNGDGLLGTLHCITHFKLDSHSFPFRLPRLPSDFPPNLSYLTLSCTDLVLDPMPVLETLPKLLHLKLDMSYRCEIMLISHAGFPRLQRLVLRQGPFTVNKIRVEEGAMPELRRWEIIGGVGPKFENLPQHLRSKIVYHGSYPPRY